MIPQPVYMNSQQLFSQTSVPDNETTFPNSGNINSQDKTSIITDQGTLAPNCTVTANENTSNQNVNFSVKTSVVAVNADALTG